MSGLRVIFMGTPDFSVSALEALCVAGHDVICVYSQPPRRAGRGRALKPGPVHRVAEARGIPVRTPVSLKDPDAQAAFAALDADVAVVAAYGLILPAPVLKAPRLGCINIHASLLPRWRGAAPIQRAIMAGDTETGISIMQMDAGLDTGPVLLTRSLPIGPDTTAGALHDALAALGAEMIVSALAGLAARILHAIPQPETGACTARKITAEDERIDWTRSAAEIARLVRALGPRPGAHFLLGGERWKLLAAKSVGATTKMAPGTAIDGALTIACGSGAVKALSVQRPGRKPMDADAALHGHPVAAGTRLD